MVLADTSVWIQHFRHGEPRLAGLLSEGLVLIHPFIVGELACGSLKDRATVLAWLGQLPQATPATSTEALSFLEERRLWGRGLGWTDVHLLASANLAGCAFWTLDRRLTQAAKDLRIPTF